MEESSTIAPTPATEPAAPSPAPQQQPMPPMPGPSVPPHTQTQSTLAPTAEFTRIFLLAWIIRYIFRGAAGALFEEKIEQPGIRAKILNSISNVGRHIQKWFGGHDKISLKELEAGAYSLSVGMGSGALSWTYGNAVRADILNLFRESVAEEKGVPADQVTFKDISQSDNAIIKRTVENYHGKMRERLGTDALFFLATPLRSTWVTDLLLGVKGVQIFSDTWKRKTTLFEDLVTFVNNKINPRNGLGQPITVGEVFDLYQHYADMFHPDRMFSNVLERGTGEGIRWAKSQPIFLRITELMNATYAYKHASVIDPETGHAKPQANLALPKLVYLLGNDYIDPDKPEETLLAIEITNKHGIPAAKQMRGMLAEGQSLEAIQQHFGVTLPATFAEQKTPVSEKNGVIAKGSTMQLDATPAMKIDVNSIAHEPMLQSAQLATTL